MGKPDISVYDRFREKFFRLTKQAGKEQYLVPYLMSSHPGSRLSDAVELALYIKRIGLSPEQVQDFYPTPGTASTVMYYTGMDPLTGKKVYTATDYKEKQMQRALLQYWKLENRRLVMEALHRCGREDLIGYGPDCLIRPSRGGNQKPQKNRNQSDRSNDRSRAGVSNKKFPVSKGGHSRRGKRK